ncbi:MAG: acyl-CoA dehydrogenase family protein [Caulobacterales bacterium]
MTTTEHQDTAEDAAYRAKARAWLAANAAEYRSPGAFTDATRAAHSKAYTRKKWDAGYSGIHVPESEGGAGGTKRQAEIFAEEESGYQVPPTTAHHLAMTAYQHYGTPEQKARWGKIMWSGAGAWTQLFSEPSAGSDLAALRTKAVKDGDKYIVNGQKIWSTYAHDADYGFIIVRTDYKAVKHKGLSFFFINMRQPGITVRPIAQMTGDSDFNEVFFEDAILEEKDRIGAEGQGWAVAMTVLGAERTGAGTAGARSGDNPVSTANLLRAARNARRDDGVALDSAAVRAQLARFYVDEQGVKNFGVRMAAQMAAGAPPPASMPVMKLTSATRNQLAFAFLQDMEESGGIVQKPDKTEDKYFGYLYSPIWRIAGGADQVLRNQLSERALGMPADIRPDKDVPFDQVPFSAPKA